MNTPGATSEKAMPSRDRAEAGSELILKPALQVTLLSLANIVVGFLVQVVLAAKFGTSIEMDAYLAATTIPTTITAILVGALGITFVPIFTRYRNSSGQVEAWQVASSFTNLFTLILVAIAGIGMVASEELLRVTVPGFVDSPQFASAVHMSRILYPSIVFVGVAALFSSVAYAERKFVRPAAAPVLNNGVIILGALVMSDRLGIEAVAWASLGGALAQFFLLLPVAIGSDRFKLALDLRHPGVKQVLRVMSPLILGAIIFRSNTVADRFVASMLSTGSISYLGYGLKLLNILWAITSSGIVLSVFPLQSEHAGGDRDALGQITSTGLRLSIILTMGMGTCFLVLREVAIKALFERGAFDAQATRAVADILVFYAGALFVQGMFGSVTYALYSLQQTGLTTLVAVAGTLVNLILLIPLSQWLGANGVALAYSVASISNAVWLTYLLVSRFRVRIARNVLACSLKSLSAAAVAGGLVGLLGAVFFTPSAHSALENSVWLLSMTILFVVLYARMLLLLKVEDAKTLLGRIRFKTSHFISSSNTSHPDALP